MLAIGLHQQDRTQGRRRQRLDLLGDARERVAQRRILGHHVENFALRLQKSARRQALLCGRFCHRRSSQTYDCLP